MNKTNELLDKDALISAKDTTAVSGGENNETKSISKRTGVKIAFGMLLMILLIVVAVIVFADSKLNKLNYDDSEVSINEAYVPNTNDEVIDTLNIEGYEVKESGGETYEGDILREKNIVNILVIGSDERLINTSDKGRADAVMLVSLNKSNGAIKLASFERAMGMPVEGKKDYKLNDLLNLGDAILIQETISKSFNVDIDGYMHVDYDSFPVIIDSIGGLDIYFTQKEANNLNWRITRDPRFDLVAVEGINHLDGYDALVYCRLRDTDDNWERQRRTRTVMEAAAGKVKDMSLSELNSLADTVLPLVHTNLTKKQIASLFVSAPKFLNPTFSQLMVPDKEKTWVYEGENNEAMRGYEFKYETERLHEFIKG